MLTGSSFQNKNQMKKISHVYNSNDIEYGWNIEYSQDGKVETNARNQF